MTCAGPAFERAFRLRHELPLYNKGAGKDLRQINRLAHQVASGKSVGGPYGVATTLRRMAWNGAQRLVAHHHAAAEAVRVLAGAVLCKLDGDGAFKTFALPAVKVEAVLREAGIAPGAFEPRQLIESRAAA